MKVFLVSFEIFLIFILIPSGLLQLVPSKRKCIMQTMFEIKDGTCKNYYMCIFNGVEFVSYDLSCASGMVFDPSLKYCTSPSDYVCTQATTTPSSTSMSTQPSTSSTSSSTPISTPSSTLTSSSVSTASSTLSTTPSTLSPSSTSTSISTPLSTSSSVSTSTPSTVSTSTPSTVSTSTPSTVSTSTPSTVSTSTPSTVSTSTPSTVSTSTPSTVSTSTPSTVSTSTTETPCVANGRFALKDPKCQKYYFCYLDGATYIRYNLTCPNNLRFNPTTQKCVLPASYPCPVA